MSNSALIVFRDFFPAVKQQILRRELLEDSGGIDNRYHGINPRQSPKACAVGIVEHKGLGYRQRLGNTRGLDQELVEAPFSGYSAHFYEKIFPKSAANAPVGHLYKGLLRVA